MSESKLTVTDQEAEATGRAVGVFLWVYNEAIKGNFDLSEEQAIAVNDALDELAKFDQKGLEILFEGAKKARGEES
ncbi:hypothetical protein ACQCU3_12710 [Bacillus altitudinis]|uniref:hypothetical protein n=1 Tax=Bacillus altitudinis TaxID=293387 RepID=UPI0011E8C0F6|nr:hypothetical protein [Bacillus altitudinis]TYS26970.1 hypothetical protein FZC69_13795 [Bacillus altitudinis]